jgi:hypothetical protein
VSRPSNVESRVLNSGTSGSKWSRTECRAPALGTDSTRTRQWSAIQLRTASNGASSTGPGCNERFAARNGAATRNERATIRKREATESRVRSSSHVRVASLRSTRSRVPLEAPRSKVRVTKHRAILPRYEAPRGNRPSAPSVRQSAPSGRSGGGYSGAGRAMLDALRLLPVAIVRRIWDAGKYN